jgi:hypothetical protein
MMLDPDRKVSRDLDAMPYSYLVIGYTIPLLFALTHTKRPRVSLSNSTLALSTRLTLHLTYLLPLLGILFYAFESSVAVLLSASSTLVHLKTNLPSANRGVFNHCHGLHGFFYGLPDFALSAAHSMLELVFEIR